MSGPRLRLAPSLTPRREVSARARVAYLRKGAVAAPRDGPMIAQEPALRREDETTRRLGFRSALSSRACQGCGGRR